MGEANAPTLLATRLLEDLLEHHGLVPRVDGTIITLDEIGLRVECGVDDDFERFSGGALCVHVRLWTDHTEPFIWVQVPGSGPTLAEALSVALGNWLHNVFETVRAAQCKEDRQPDFAVRVVTETPSSEITTEWKIFEGNLVILRDGPLLQMDTRDILGEKRIFNRVAQVFTEVVNRSVDRPMHWIQVQLFRRLDGSHRVDCQVDNVFWPHEVPELAAFPWPNAPGFLSIWYFCLCSRVNCTYS